jgi:hypothetical protein
VKTYLVFEPPAGGRTLAVAERVVFLREQFSLAALLLAPFWLLWHRLWLGFVGWLILTVAIGAAGNVLGLDSYAGFAASAIPALIVAFEGTALQRRKLVYRGFHEAGVVVAEDLEGAERRFFDAWTKPAKLMPPVTTGSPGPLPPVAPNPVIGLFPEPGAPR